MRTHAPPRAAAHAVALGGLPGLGTKGVTKITTLCPKCQAPRTAVRRGNTAVLGTGAIIQGDRSRAKIYRNPLYPSRGGLRGVNSTTCKKIYTEVNSARSHGLCIDHKIYKPPHPANIYSTPPHLRRRVLFRGFFQDAFSFPAQGLQTCQSKPLQEVFRPTRPLGGASHSGKVIAPSSRFQNSNP